MASNIEIEAKVLLSEEDYQKLLAYFHLEHYKRIKQTNHYIDSEELVLKKNDFALRVREKDDFQLTLKTPLSEGLLEKNQMLSWRDYDNLEDENIFPSGDIKNFLEICGFDVKSLKVMASLTTYRIEFEVDDGKISLDENFYGKHNETRDYEFEVESSSMEKAEKLATQFLNEAGINEFSFNHHSKQSRAIRAITAK